jgi:signal transduction histidine kinase
MLRKIIGLFVAALALAGVNSVALAAGGTPDEAKAMVEKAIKLIEAEGKDKAIATINSTGGGGFIDRDLYVVFVDMTGTTRAHAANQALVGKVMLNVKDADGKEFVKEMVTGAQSAGSGWVDYKWPNPQTKKIEQKSSYYKKVGDLIVLVGVYKG